MSSANGNTATNQGDTMQASVHAITFVEAYNEKFNRGADIRSRSEASIRPGRKYDSVISTSGYGSSSSMLYVDRENGDLIKSAGCAPQRNSDGTMAVRYNVATPEGLQEVVQAADRFAGFMYKR